MRFDGPSRRNQVNAYLYTDRDTRTTVNKHLVVPVAQTNETAVESVAAGDPEAVRTSDEEHDGLFELHLLDVATPVALGIGTVRLLGDQQVRTGVHPRDVVHGWNRLEWRSRSGVRIPDVMNHVHALETMHGGSGRGGSEMNGSLVGTLFDSRRHRRILKLRHHVLGRGVACRAYGEGVMGGGDRRRSVR